MDNCVVCGTALSACPVLNSRLGSLFVDRHVMTDPVSSLFLARSINRREQERYAVRMLPVELWGDPVARLAFSRAQHVRSCFKPHPNVAQVLDVGEDPNGGLWMVLEWVDGQWLDDYLGEEGVTPLPVSRAVDLARQMVAAVQELHAHQLVHGRLHLGAFWRIKQMTERDDWLRLIHAGMCRSLDPATSGPERELMTSLTWSVKPGEEPWSPYLPLHGDESNPTIKGDLHAISVCLYELLTGCLPWNVRGEWVPLPERRERVGRHPRLVNLLDRAIGPGEEPFQSADDLLSELKKLLHGVREIEEKEKAVAAQVKASASWPRFNKAAPPNAPSDARGGLQLSAERPAISGSARVRSSSRPRGVRGALPQPTPNRSRARVRARRRHQTTSSPASATHVQEDAILKLAGALSNMADATRSELNRRKKGRSRRAAELSDLLGAIPEADPEPADPNASAPGGAPRRGPSGARRPGRVNPDASSLGRRASDVSRPQRMRPNPNASSPGLDPNASYPGAVRSPNPNASSPGFDPNASYPGAVRSQNPNASSPGLDPNASHPGAARSPNPNASSLGRKPSRDASPGEQRGGRQAASQPGRRRGSSPLRRRPSGRASHPGVVRSQNPNASSPGRDPNASYPGAVRSQNPNASSPGFDPNASQPGRPYESEHGGAQVSASLLRPSRPRPYRSKTQPPADPAPSPGSRDPLHGPGRSSSSSVLGQPPSSTPSSTPFNSTPAPNPLPASNIWISVALSTSLSDSFDREVRDNHRQTIMRSARPLFEMAEQVVQANNDYAVFLLRRGESIKVLMGQVVRHLITIARSCAPHAPAVAIVTEHFPSGLSVVAEEARLSELATASEEVARSVAGGHVVATAELVADAGLDTVFHSVPRPTGAVGGRWTSFMLGDR